MPTRRQSKSTPSVSPVMRKLSKYMAHALDRTLPEDVIEKAKHLTLDTLGAMVSGIALPQGRVILNFARQQAGRREACIAGSKIMTSAIDAAFVNGLAAHLDETDDSHAPSYSHPACAVVPAALAMAERNRRSGKDLLKAVVLGYDVGCRVTMTLGTKFFYEQRYMSTHTFVAGFGAHAAAGALSGLNESQMRWLLAYAAQQASGTAVHERDSGRFQVAFDLGGGTARNGVASALMVNAGFTAVDDVFSGQYNFFASFSPKADPKGLVRHLGSVYEIMNTNIKKWCVGSPIQAVLDSLERLIITHELKADMVDKVIVRTGAHEAPVVDNREAPTICMQHMTALMLQDGTVTFASAHDTDRMRDPAVLRQRAKVDFIHDRELAKARPRRHGIVEVTTRDGRHLRDRTDDVRGTALNPMSREEIEDKCRSLLEPVLGRRKTKRLIAEIWDLERVKDVRAIRPLLQAAVGTSCPNK